MPEASLGARQASFFEAVTARNETTAEVLGAPRFFAAHRAMWFSRMHDALANELPAVRAAIGGERFEAFARDYLAAHPSRSPTLHALAANVPAFLREHTLGREHPALVDLARLERARSEAADAANDAPFTASALARGPEASLRLAPCAHVLILDHDVLDAWLAADRGEPMPACAHERTAILVWRGPEFLVRHRALDAIEETLVARLLRPASLAEICGALARDRSIEQALALAHRLVGQWIADELLVAAERFLER